jgi:hypothetical protein
MPPNLFCYHSTISIHKIKYKGERIVIVIKIDPSGPYSILFIHTELRPVIQF